MMRCRSRSVLLAIAVLGLGACSGPSGTGTRAVERQASLGAVSVAEGVLEREPWTFGDAPGEVIVTCNKVL